MVDYFQRIIAWLMNRVRVNHVQPAMHDGEAVFVKRRRLGASLVVWFANRFLALARSGCCMFVRADEWAEWEVHCAELLYPERRVVKVGRGQAIAIPKVNGTSLRQTLCQNAKCAHAFIAAARELRRVHQLPCRYYQAAWSHGDLHLDNVVYDVDADRAFLIDFDTRHESSLSQTQRQCDDLKVFLLELQAVPDERWRELATLFVENYGDASVLCELSHQLFVPQGFAKILWYARTNCSSRSRSEPRLSILQEIIHATAEATCVFVPSPP
jgi:hypothetical protein